LSPSIYCRIEQLKNLIKTSNHEKYLISAQVPDDQIIVLVLTAQLPWRPAVVRRPIYWRSQKTSFVNKLNVEFCEV